MFSIKKDSHKEEHEKVKKLKLNIEREEKIVNKKIKEEFSLKNATLYGGYNLFSDYLASNGLDRLLEEE